MNSFDAIFQFDSAVFWAGVGIVLLVVEVVFFGGFYLSFAAAAFAIAGLILFEVAPTTTLWKGVVFAGLGLALTPLLKTWIRRYLDKTPDINQY